MLVSCGGRQSAAVAKVRRFGGLKRCFYCQIYLAELHYYLLFSSICCQSVFGVDYLYHPLDLDVQVVPRAEVLRLVQLDKIEKFKEKYKFLCIGSAQIAIKPLCCLGLDTPMLGHQIYSLFELTIVVFLSNLANRTVYFKCYPYFIVSLFYSNIIKTPTLNIQTPNDMLRDSRNVAIIYRIYIKIAATNIAPGTLKKSPRNQTLLIDKSYILII